MTPVFCMIDRCRQISHDCCCIGGKGHLMRRATPLQALIATAAAAAATTMPAVVLHSLRPVVMVFTIV